uniref:Uncharacterized protein n=1 Tax=Pseudomonas phage RVTF4 TaxID=3236931 RepID=A0AB39CCS1_9VIRU
MQYIIDSVLTPLVTEERKEVVLKCVASLESLEFNDSLDELQQVVEMTDTMGDNAMMLARIDDVIWNAHEVIFKRHEITVSNEATQEVRQSLVDVVSNFDKYIIPDQLLMLFEGAFMPEEILAQMCQLFTGIHADEVWPEVKGVSENLMRTMKEEIERQVRYRGLEDADPVPVMRVKMVNDFIRAMGEGTLSMALDLARAGVRVGTRTASSLVQQSVEALDKKEPEQAALELFGLVLISDVEPKQIEKQVRDYVTDFTDDNHQSRRMLDTLKAPFEMLKGYVDENA